MGFLDDAKKFIDEHDEQVDHTIEEAGDLVDQQTGGTYAAQVDQAQDFAEEKTGAGDTARDTAS
jgi:MT0933-like antitoxin protein